MEKDKPLNEYRTELKQRILQYAGEMFATKGIRAVNMESISKGLGISKRTIYELYVDKEALLLACIQNYHNSFHAHMSEYASSGHNSIEIIKEFFTFQLQMTSHFNPQFFDDLKRFPNVLAFFEEHNRLRDKYASDFFKHGVEEGFFLPDVDYELVVRIGTITFHSVMQQGLYNEYSLDSIITNALRLYIRGLCTEKGIEGLG